MARKLKIDTGGAVFGPYSPGISVKDHIWLSGQVDVSADGIEAQTRGTLAKVDGLLAAANSSKSDLVKVTVLLADIGFYPAVNEIYSEWLGEVMPPARAAYGVADLPGGALIEIVCEAFRGCGGA
tara:strand:- start:282 stop:656 length:375 start_codon:yes stop_codon:yes gene_type:complete